MKWWKNRKKDPQGALSQSREEYQHLHGEIQDLQKQIAKTEMLFNLTSEEELIEAYIYERSAQDARMSYLCRLAKEKGVKATV